LITLKNDRTKSGYRPQEHSKYLLRPIRCYKSEAKGLRIAAGEAIKMVADP